MKILFTGGSSFTGYWFIRSLVEKGHEVVATFRKPQSAYSDIRAERVSRITKLCKTHFVCPTPSAHFQSVIEGQSRWDLWCQHAAEVADYKNPAFDPLHALQVNCADLDATLQKLQNRHCKHVLLTGTVFEQGEGGLLNNTPAVSPYGLSKGMTSDFYAFYLQRRQMLFGKCVIPNPFGPFEEARLTTFLVQSWKRGETPTISTPTYIRDNIHVSLLAKAYAQFAEDLVNSTDPIRFRPSGYISSQRAFVDRFAREIGLRLEIKTPVDYVQQTDFSEPMERVNDAPLDTRALGWSESEAWDDLANYYRQYL